MGAQIDPLPSPASLGQALGQADAATHAGDVTTPASAVAGESPPVPSAAKGGSVDPSSVSERELARLPHNHSWRWSPPVYTAASCLIFLLFFVQPHSWRVRLYSSLRSLVDDERQFYTLGSLTVHTLSFAALNGGMALIYWAGLPFFEQFKIESKPWPWHRGPKERAQYFALVRKTLALISFNLYFLQPILLWVGYRDGKRMGMGGDPSPEAVPAWYTSMWQIAVCMLVEDTLFYWSHRMLHWPRIYGYVHKVHHQYKTSIGLASEYAHPIEFIVSNAIPFTAGPLLLGVHYWTWWQWTILRLGETVDGHCGYEFPWSPYRLLPFSGSSTAHDYHHSHNLGNYASFFSWWDRLCGTDRPFVAFERKQIALRAAQHEAREKLRAQGKLREDKVQ